MAAYQDSWDNRLACPIMRFSGVTTQSGSVGSLGRGVFFWAPMKNEQTSTIERRLLQWLCQGGSDAKLRAEAILRTFYRQPWFYGMYWWKWYSTGDGGGPDDPKLPSMNKPAAEIMSHWHRGPERRNSR